MRFPIVLRGVRRVVAGGALASLAILGSSVLRAGMMRSLYPSREDDERYRLLAEKSSDLVCLHEPDGRYLYISPSCRRLLGYEPEDLLGTDPYDLFHPEDLERIRSEAHEKALDGQGAVSVTYRIRKESGDYTWFETLTEPILDESGEVVRLQTASRDVSERRRAEEALAEVARARAEFLAEVSHKLRTPLPVIRGNAEVGLELDRDCEHEEVLREIVRESSTMSRMVKDLLFLARTESAAPPFRMEPVESLYLAYTARCILIQGRTGCGQFSLLTTSLPVIRRFPRVLLCSIPYTHFGESTHFYEVW